MHVVHPVCGGMDGHAAQWTACLRRVHDAGQISTEWRDFGTTYAPLLALRAWLDEQGCPIVVLESTGVYWKPLSPVWVETLEVVVANAHSVRQRPGKKTDTSRCRVAGGTLGPWAGRAALYPAASDPRLA